MALFVFIILIINNCINSLSGSENSNYSHLKIKPSSVTGGRNVGFYKVEDTLNLTCTFSNDTFLPNVILEWTFPTNASNSQNRVTMKHANFITLTIENLQETDSGDYKCTAVHNGIPFFKYESIVTISVKNKKKECTDVMFQCSAGMCIPKRYTCDGQVDCLNGEDESPVSCGPGNPCDNKLMCPDNRCIPFTWCCELHREPNCTAKVKHSCCFHVEKLTRDVDPDMGYQYEQQRFNGLGFLQTTVYTVIGCAMAFMFIVTIIVIAICRVHVRRTLLSRCPAANRNLSFGRGGNIHGNQLNGLSFYDLDLYLNRSGLSGSDLMAVNPLLVTYNINNGVQFVGRPVDPPPYCEIVTSPPKEGPPPPYASREDLASGEMSSERKAESELLEICTEPEPTESDALLGAMSPNISVISCNAIDVPCTDEVSHAETLNQLEPDPGVHSEDSSNSGEPIVNFNSSRIDGDVDKNVDCSKHSNVDIVLLKNCDSTVTEGMQMLKVQNGESTSYVSSDLNKGAVRKLGNVKTIESNCKKKTRVSCKSHSNKF